MPDLSSIENTILIVGGAVAVVLCIAILILVKKRRLWIKSGPASLARDPSHPPLRVQKIPANLPDSTSDPGLMTDSPPHPKRIDCVKGRADLTESLAALAEKYSLDEITLATADGLLLASSRKSAPADAVARYAGMFAENERPWPPGIVLFGLEHKGSYLVGIARVRDLLAQEPDQDMVRETKDILNRWI